MGCGWFMDLRFPLALRSAPWIVSSLITGSWGESLCAGYPDSGRHRAGTARRRPVAGRGERRVPQLVVDDALACLRYAADLANERFLPLRQP